MGSLIMVFISLFTFLIGICGQQKCKLNVGSFNLGYDNEGDEDDSWALRKDMAVSLVHFHDFDVFGIQEGLIHQVKDLVKDGTYTFVGVGRDDGRVVNVPVCGVPPVIPARERSAPIVAAQSASVSSPNSALASA